MPIDDYTPPEKPTLPFAAEAVGAFAYPLTLRGVIAIVGASLVFAACFVIYPALPTPPRGYYGRRRYSAQGLLVAFIAMTAWYLTAYLADMLWSSSDGERETPEWPGVRGSVGNPFWMIGPVAVSIAVPLLAAFLTASIAGADLGNAGATVALAAGCLYLPMALLATMLLRTPLAMSPHVVVPAMVRAPAGTVISAALIFAAIMSWGALNARVSAWAAEGSSFFAPFFAHFAADLVAIYLFFVAMRVIGVTYWTHRRKLGWFENV